MSHSVQTELSFWSALRALAFWSSAVFVKLGLAFLVFCRLCNIRFGLLVVCSLCNIRVRRLTHKMGLEVSPVDILAATIHTLSYHSEKTQHRPQPY